MSNKITKRMALQCNEKLLQITGGITCTILGDFIESAQKELSLPVENLILGNAIKICLENSKELTGEEWAAQYGTNCQEFSDSMGKKVEERDAEIMREYGFKDEKALYKNMMYSSILNYENIFEINSFSHIKLTVWDWTDDKIRVSQDVPPELLGATVRYAFSRCKGKGPYAKGAEIVTKALFPEGVPNSLEEYLESVNKDYRKWLIYE